MADLSQFVVLAPSISLFQPQSFTSTSPTILILPWFNASSRNIEFYVRKYTSLSPSARIFLLRNMPSNMIYRSEAAQVSDITPVIQAFLAEPSSPIFAHVFSNTGAQQMGLLLRSFKKMTGQMLELRGLILDSAPSIGTFASMFDGLVYPIQGKYWWVRIPGTALAYAIVNVVCGIEKVTGNLNVVAQANHDLLDEELIEKEVERWYMYSKADKLVMSDEIEWHAGMAKKKGWRTEMVVFENSGHCQHGKGVGEARYWNIIESIMNKTRREGKL